MRLASALVWVVGVQQATTFAPSTILLGQRYCGNAGRLARGGGGGVSFPLKFSLRQGHGVRSLSSRLDQGGSVGGGPVTFESLGLRPELLEAVKKLGYGACSDIQQRALPHALSGLDVVGKAKTGSGKTAVFGLACLQKLDLALDHRGGRPQALVLSPTRELATQLVASIRGLATGMPGVRVLAVTGGSPSRDQRARLEAGAHVVVATPGRCLQLLELGNLDPRFVSTLVLDEADTLLDMGFEEEVNRILKFLPPQRQTLLFSATWADRVEGLSKRLQRNPKIVSDGQAAGEQGQATKSVAAQVDPSLLKQSALLFKGGQETRLEALCHVLATADAEANGSNTASGEQGGEGSCVVFCETRIQCKEVAEALVSRGASALALHGELEQNDREKTLVRFRNKSCRILVATNVASRGLDVEGVSLVVCFELNDDPAVHIHRVGRTARAESKGTAVSLVCVGSGGKTEQRNEHGAEGARLDAIDAALGGHPMTRISWTPPSNDVSGRGMRDSQLEGWAAEWHTVLVLGGRRDKLRPGDVLGALSGSDVGLQGNQVGKIEVTEQRTWVAVRRAVAAKAAQALDVTKIKKRRFKAHLIR